MLRTLRMRALQLVVNAIYYKRFYALLQLLHHKHRASLIIDNFNNVNLWLVLWCIMR